MSTKEPFWIFSTSRVGIGGKAGDNIRGKCADATGTMLVIGVVINEDIDGMDHPLANGVFEGVVEVTANECKLVAAGSDPMPALAEGPRVNGID